MTTFDEARAACVERWGEPASCDERPGHTTIAWVASPGRVVWPDTYWLEGGDGCVLLVALRGTKERLWLLAGVDMLSPERTVTPLPDAIDAAVRRMAERSDPMKGP